MKGRGWAWVLAGAIALGVPAVAAADDYGRGRDGWGRNDRGRSRSGGWVQQRAANRGYEEGQSDGERDARGRRGFNLYHDKTYRDADAGYNDRYGSRREYARAFRSGYEEGYREAFRAYSRYDRYDRYDRRDRTTREIPRRW